MKKRIVLILLALICVVMLAACGECEHDWAKATCEDPKTCENCGETKGEAKGHEWGTPVCGEPLICEECDEEGETVEHDWFEATCEEPKTCKACGETEGDPLPHDWADATYDAPKTCNSCGGSEGEPLKAPSASNLGISYEDYAAMINKGAADSGYRLDYLQLDDEGDPIYGVYSEEAADYLGIAVIFQLDSDGETVTAVLVSTEDIADSDTVYVTGFLAGVSWGISNPDLDRNAVNDMLASTPIEGDNGSIIYYMEDGGRGYYIIISETLMVLMVEAQ